MWTFTGRPKRDDATDRLCISPCTCLQSWSCFGGSSSILAH